MKTTVRIDNNLYDIEFYRHSDYAIEGEVSLVSYPNRKFFRHKFFDTKDFFRFINEFNSIEDLLYNAAYSYHQELSDISDDDKKWKEFLDRRATHFKR